ncbi:MAG: hypothetical protein ACR2IK_12390 [Chloroflexota bacterium]
MDRPVRGRPETAPPAAGSVLRGSLLAGGVTVILLALAGLVAGTLAPSQALAAGLAGVGLISLGVGFTVEIRVLSEWPRP